MCSAFNKTNEVEHAPGSKVLEWKNHRRRADEAMKMKGVDKNRPAEDQGKRYRTITFDLEGMLSVPCAGDKQLFYKRKLNAYNFAINKGHSQDGFCYTLEKLKGKIKISRFQVKF